MQPYFLPYIGYFQLMAAVDKWVVLDDVNYINRGWINRNRILLNGAAHTVTVPLRGASQNKLIYQIELLDEQRWRKILLKTIQQAYTKAPFFKPVLELMNSIINHPTNQLDKFLLNSLQRISEYLSLDVEIIETSRIYNNAQLTGQNRILDICRKEKANIYINSIGGVELYENAAFERQGITLHFLQTRPIHYAQANDTFFPWLSILDVLMFNETCHIQNIFSEIDLKPAFSNAALVKNSSKIAL